jgi:hypothetical protein
MAGEPIVNLKTAAAAVPLVLTSHDRHALLGS